MYNLRKPIICIICGVAGSGKSTLGNLISEKLHNSVFLPKDLIQNPFTKTERTGKMYEHISLPTFNILLNFAHLQLDNYKTPIIDAPFSFNHNKETIQKDWVTHFKKIADKHKTRLAVIRCIPPNEQNLKKRLSERNYEWDKWKLDNWEEFKQREPFYFPIPHDDVFEILTSFSPELISEKILNDFLKAERV
jgi:guanylate kinase